MMFIRYVTSLGPRCHTASFLKRNQLKQESYPFDWIFSNTDMIIHCLEDNFNTFLDKSYYTITDPESKKQQHSVYSESPDEILFNHHNPLKAEDNMYFNRCITRFKNVLAQPELKMFVLFFLNFTKIDHLFKQKIMDFNKQFGRHTQNYGILCIVQYTSNKNSYIFTVNDNVHFLEIYTTSNSNGVEFENPDDNLFLDNVIMDTYKFSLIDTPSLSSGVPIEQNVPFKESYVEHEFKENIIIEHEFKEPDADLVEENIINGKEYKDSSVQTDDNYFFEKVNLSDNRLFNKSLKSFPALERYQNVLHKEGIDVVIEEIIEPIIEPINDEEAKDDEETISEEAKDEETVIDDSTVAVENPIIVEKKKKKRTDKLLNTIRTTILGRR